MWLFKIGLFPNTRIATWRLFAMLATASIALTGCGFTPLYSKHSKHNSAAVQQTLETKIEKIPGRSGQILWTTLMDHLNPSSIPVTPHYRLVVTLQEKEIPVAIQQDRHITRYNIIEEANYSLISIESNKQIDNGHVRVIGSYDAVDSDFATFAAKQDTIKRAMQEMGMDIGQRVIAAFLKQANKTQ